MENASKAIIIAGAVIIVLLIISLAVYFYSQSTGVVDIFGKKISATEIKNHNNSFLVYDGEVLGVEVVNSCIKIKEYNVNARLPIKVTVYPEKGKSYTFSYDDIEQYQNVLNEVNRTRVYKGTVAYSNEGIIDTITFEPK